MYLFHTEDLRGRTETLLTEGMIAYVEEYQELYKKPLKSIQ